MSRLGTRPAIGVAVPSPLLSTGFVFSPLVRVVAESPNNSPVFQHPGFLVALVRFVPGGTARFFAGAAVLEIAQPSCGRLSFWMTIRPTVTPSGAPCRRQSIG
ncbi:hypothetical protein NITMOv2_1169 [Nitrospira moscoviensis]|uniref:Uncharacterized protein n=1 Tax=Nitrospira moscoviensis TaxID=42253 RepID=A0A0K2G9I4_NITMO|nr:hypothetical protein NITMOv2_1169 [Nitrospira moscoviensis]